METIRRWGRTTDKLSHKQMEALGLVFNRKIEKGKHIKVILEETAVRVINGY